MRRKERNITNPETIKEILKANHLAVVSMIDGNIPYAVMMNYAPEWKGEEVRLIFHCAKAGRKFDCLNQNPFVSVFINDENREQVINAGKESCKWTTHYRSIILSGKIRFIEDLSSKRQMAKVFMLHYTDGEIELSEVMLNSILFLELKPQLISGKQNQAH